MSEKKIKQERKDFEERRKAFLEGIRELGLKHKVDVVAVLDFSSPSQIRATNVIVDIKKDEPIKPSN